MLLKINTEDKSIEILDDSVSLEDLVKEVDNIFGGEHFGEVTIVTKKSCCNNGTQYTPTYTPNTSPIIQPLTNPPYAPTPFWYSTGSDTSSRLSESEDHIIGFPHEDGSGSSDVVESLEKDFNTEVQGKGTDFLGNRII